MSSVFLQALPYCYTISFSERKGFTWGGGSVSKALVTPALVLEIGFLAPLKPGIVVHVSNLMLEEGHRDRKSSQGSTILPNSDQTFIWMRLEGTLDIKSKTGGEH